MEAIIAAPFGSIGLHADATHLLDIRLYPTADRLIAPSTPLLQAAALQFAAYFQNPHSPFTLPLPGGGTAYQQRVWRALSAIPPGAVKSYQQLANELASGPRAIAGACRANPFALVIPCHRVVARQHLGGYCGALTGPLLDIKRWLLRHEGYAHTT